MFGIFKALFGGGATKKPDTRKPANPDRIRRLKGDGDFNLKVSGTSNYQGEIKAAEKSLGSNHSGDFLVSLVPDPENQFDANAIRVLHKGKTLGFVPKDQTDGIHLALARADLVGAECKALARVVGHGKGTLGLRLNVAQPPTLA